MVELIVSRLRCREIRLHAHLICFRRCHCFLQSLHHTHELLHGHLFTLSARRTLSRGSYHLEPLLAVVHFQRIEELELRTNVIVQRLNQINRWKQHQLSFGKIVRKLGWKLQLELKNCVMGLMFYIGPHGGRQMFPPVDRDRLCAWLVLAS